MHCDIGITSFRSGRFINIDSSFLWNVNILYITGEPMKEIDTVKSIISNHMDVLTEKYHVKTMSVFGSYVRDEQTKTSDIDILVEFTQPVGLFTFIELEEYLSDLLGLKVDLVLREGIKPGLKDHILHEAISL
jgi:predicted nucleotidyltransferase